MKNYFKTKSADWPIIILALLNIALHLVGTNNLEYHRDELLYFSLGLHPSAGYATVPPLIGWVAFLMQNLFGYSVLAVRLFPALLSGAMILLVASMARELGGSKYAAFLSALGLSISIFFMRSYFLFQPVHIEIFLWTLCIYLIIKYLNTFKSTFLLYFGIAAGFALLNKYLALFLFTGLVVIIPFTQYRNIFRQRMFWIGIATGFLIFLPNLLWQVINGFPVFNHMSELYDTQLVYMDAPLFLTEQLIMPFAGSVFTIAGLYFLLTDRNIRKFRFLGFLAIFVIGGLMLMKGKSYYTLGIFPLLIVSGAVAYDHWFNRVWVKIVFPVILVLITIPVVPIGIPVLGQTGLKNYFKALDEKYGIDLGRRFEDGSIHSLPQDYADMLGWEELTALADKGYNMISDKAASFIYCENYGEAGAVTIIGKKYGLPEAISFHESFNFWYPKEFNPDITSLIYINNEMGDDIKNLFSKITIIGKISDPDAREYGTTVYLCEDPVMSFNKFWKERTEGHSE